VQRHTADMHLEETCTSLNGRSPFWHTTNAPREERVRVVASTKQKEKIGQKKSDVPESIDLSEAKLWFGMGKAKE